MFVSLLILVGYFKLVKILLHSAVGHFEAEADIKLRMISLKLIHFAHTNWAGPVDVFSVVVNLADFLTFCRHFYCSMNNIKVVKQEQN